MRTHTQRGVGVMAMITDTTTDSFRWAGSKCLDLLDACEDFLFLWTHLRVLGNPVSQHVENSVGRSSPDDEFLVTDFVRITKTYEG